MVGNIVLLACGTVGGFILGALLAAEIGRRIYNQKMEIINLAVDRMERRLKTRSKKARAR